MDLISVKFGKAKVEMTENSAGDVFICSPEKSMAKNLGIIFGVIELNNLPEYFNEAFIDIISDLKTEYYLPPFNLETGPEKRFEECIQRANRRIHKAINDSIESIEISQLNALIGLSFKNTINMAYTGGVKANLLHLRKDGQMISVDILGNDKAKPNPEKIFFNISSGEISGRDVVFILSENTSKFALNADLINATQSNPLSIAGEVEGLLRSQSQDNNFYFLTIEPDYQRVETNGVPNQAIRQNEKIIEPGSPEHSINNLLTTQKKTERYLTPSSMPSWQKILLLTYNGIKISLIYIYPKIKKVIVFLSKKAWNFINFAIRKILKKSSGKIVNKNSKNIDNLISNIEIEEPLNLEDYVTVTSEIQTKGIFGLASKLLNKNLAKIALLNKKQKIILLVIFILFFTFSESVVLLGKNSDPKPLKATQISANQIEDKINLAEAQNIFSDLAGASAIIKEAQDLLDKIPKKRNNESLIAELQKKINNTKLSIQKVSSIDNPQLLFDLSPVGQGETIALAGQNIIVAGQNGNIYQIDLIKKQVNTIQSATGLNISKITSIDANNLLFLDNGKGVYSSTLKSTSSQNLINAISISDISYYSGYIYSLDKSKGQITKYQIKKGKATGGTTAVKNANINQSSALAVNGDFFAFKDNGEINKYSKGALTGVKYEVIDPIIKSPTHIFADSHDYLYILDKIGNKVAIYDETGAIKVQITSPKFNGLKSMAVNEKEKKIYLLSDNKIFVINTGL